PPVVGEPRAEGLPLALVRRRMGALRRTARDREGARPRERLRGSRPAARRPAARLPAPGLYRPPHERHDARDRNAAVPTGGPFRATPRRARGDPRYVQPRVLLLHAGKARDPQRPFPLPEVRVRRRPTLVPRHVARTRLPPHRSARLAPREPPSCVGRLRRRSARDGDANRRSAPEPLCCRSPFGPVDDDPEHWTTVGDRSGKFQIHLCEMGGPKSKKPPKSQVGNTGILFVTNEPFPRTCARLKRRHVRFSMPPKKLPWGWVAKFLDPDGNEFWLMPEW